MSIIMSPKNAKELQFSNDKPCAFCNSSEDDELKFGKIYEYDGIVTHYYCLLLSSNMQQRGRDEEGILGFLPADIQKELNRGRRLYCSFCKKKGATLGCVNRKCKKVFHFPCGIKENTLHQFFGQFKSFCSVHRPKQSIDIRVRSEVPDVLVCYICYETVQRDDIYKTLWAPCCKKNAWFHRDCVQQLALSAGYFFRCPLCNNKKEFQKAMQECGIFVPCQDASWELVPNAFEELLYRHNKCDAKKCNCPQGRSFTSSNAKWELILCRTCGSQGVHVDCGKLRWVNPTWECDECSTILNKSRTSTADQEENTQEEPTNQPSIANEAPKPDDDSASDISVGDDSPYENVTQALNLPNIDLKPGPRSAKLKQLHKKVETIVQEKKVCATTLEQLNDILDEQQANMFPDETYVTTGPSKSADKPVEKPSEKLIVKPVAKPLENPIVKPLEKKTDDVACVTIVDDDEDTTGEKNLPSTPKAAPTLSINTPVASGSSLMNIKITGVTSLPPEVFASVPDPPCIDLDDVPVVQQPVVAHHPIVAQSIFLDKRKADSPSIVSRIVDRVNDCLDIPENCTKRPRMDDNNKRIDNMTPSPSQVLSQNIGRLYTMQLSNGPSVQPAVASCNQQIVNTFNGLTGGLVRMQHPINETSSSDGDAGTRPADKFHHSLASRGPDCTTDELSSVPVYNGDCPTSGAKCSSVIESGTTNDFGSSGRRRYCNGSTDEECTGQQDPSSSESTKWTGSDRFRLIGECLPLKDLKFRTCGDDGLEVTVCNDYKFKITLDSAKKPNTVNNNFLCTSRLTMRSLPVRRSMRASHHNKMEEFPNHENTSNINTNNTMNNFDIQKSLSKVIDMKNSSTDKNDFLYCFDSAHSYWRCKNDKTEINGCCKYNNNHSNNNNKDVAKENLVPDKFAKQSNNVNNCDSLTSNGNYKYNNDQIDSSPGTSRDSFRELSQYSINRRHFVTTNNNNNNNNNNDNNNSNVNSTKRILRKSKRRNSFASNNIQCHVSIELDRIQGLIDSKPNLFNKDNGNLIKTSSLNNLNLDSDMKNNSLYNLSHKNQRKRSKSESYINSTSIDLENLFNANHLFDIKKKKKRKKFKKRKVCIERYDYCR